MKKIISGILSVVLAALSCMITASAEECIDTDNNINYDTYSY